MDTGMVILPCFLTVVVSYGVITKQFHFPSQNVLHRFITSSIKGRRILVVYLLLFLAHFTWAINVAFDFIVKWNFDNGWIFLVITAAIFALLMIFPYPPEIHAADNERTTIVTAFSCSKTISWTNIELILKPLIYGADADDIRTELSGISKVVILPSLQLDSHQKINSWSVDRAFHESKEANNEPNLLRPLIDKCTVASVEDDVLDKMAEDLNGLIQNKASGRSDMERVQDDTIWKQGFCSFLKTLTKKLTCRDVNFELARNSDYNSFRDFLDSAAPVMKQIDSKDVFLYISAGTNIPSSVLSLLSLVGDRKILYADQSKNTVRSVEIDSRHVEGLHEYINEVEARD